MKPRTNWRSNGRRDWQLGVTPSTLLMLALVGCVLPDMAVAADNLFGGSSPLTRFIEFITGIFAYMLVIVGIVVTLGGLILGSDMSGFSRRAPLVVVSGAVLILADTLVGTLFSGTAGAEIPAALWPWVPELLSHSGQPQ